MYLFTFPSKVNTKSEVAAEYKDFGGAYINCYISFKDAEAAEKLAKILIRERGWIPGKLKDGWKIQKRKLKTKRDKQYYAEAIKYGYTLVFHLWPKDAADANVDYERKDS